MKARVEQTFAKGRFQMSLFAADKDGNYTICMYLFLSGPLSYNCQHPGVKTFDPYG
jgi:hypothetical protein